MILGLVFYKEGLVLVKFHQLDLWVEVAESDHRKVRSDLDFWVKEWEWAFWRRLILKILCFSCAFWEKVYLGEILIEKRWLLKKCAPPIFLKSCTRSKKIAHIFRKTSWSLEKAPSWSRKKFPKPSLLLTAPHYLESRSNI